MKKSGFTLAEVLITLAIIGVVAALTIPSVVANTQQQEFKTGLKKAVSVLNSAITMNMAIDGESPYDNKDLFNYLMRHMSVMKTAEAGIARGTASKGMGYSTSYSRDGADFQNSSNLAFYTTDGMLFHIRYDWVDPGHLKLHESNEHACALNQTLGRGASEPRCGGCGSYGLASNPNNTTKTPCAIMVDVNGDRKPHPANVNCKEDSCGKTQNNYAKGLPSPTSKKVSDIFTILITEDRAIPYGVAAQKAMYEAQK